MPLGDLYASAHGCCELVECFSVETGTLSVDENVAHSKKLVLALDVSTKPTSGKLCDLLLNVLGGEKSKALGDAIAGMGKHSSVGVANVVVDGLFSVQKRPRG